MYLRGEVHSIPSSIQGAASMNSSASLDNSLSDMYRSPPRPLPYDADPRYIRLQRDGLISRREKGSSHSHEEAEPLRSDTDADSESLSTGEKWNGSACEDGSIEHRSKSSMKLSSAKATTGVGNFYTSSEDEDVCPTCLEEYTPENPKIMTKCSHHFHLGCIYEWMERSESCPVCGKANSTIADTERDGTEWDGTERNGEGANMTSDGNKDEEEGDGDVIILCSMNVERVVPGE
ncbi:hypothetical protein DVH24_032058 [Malus domestica]|uniref:RING-type E3 ubiquitin transferase n=1 Tax=Malus domestica TaxID=3750 RepID=A0A498J8I3_MALDO|nr:hypothetical protein DVH24_032058 [Malus domestica]